MRTSGKSGKSGLLEHIDEKISHRWIFKGQLPAKGFNAKIRLCLHDTGGYLSGLFLVPDLGIRNGQCSLQGKIRGVFSQIRLQLRYGFLVTTQQVVNDGQVLGKADMPPRMPTGMARMAIVMMRMMAVPVSSTGGVLKAKM